MIDKYIEFNGKHPKAKTDECMSALLNMAVEGYQSLLHNKGFISTKEGDAALEEFVTENNTVIQWLSECEIDEEHLLHEPYQKRCKWSLS